MITIIIMMMSFSSIERDSVAVVESVDQERYEMEVKKEMIREEINLYY